MSYTPSLDEKDLRAVHQGNVSGDVIYEYRCPRCNTVFEVWGNDAKLFAETKAKLNKALRDYAIYDDEIECPECGFPVNSDPEGPQSEGTTELTWGPDSDQWDGAYPEGFGDRGVVGELIYTVSTDPAFEKERNEEKFEWFTCTRCTTSFYVTRLTLIVETITETDEDGFPQFYKQCPTCNYKIELNAEHINDIIPGSGVGGSVGNLAGAINYGANPPVDTTVVIQPVDASGTPTGTPFTRVYTASAIINWNLFRPYGRYNVSVSGRGYTYTPSFTNPVDLFQSSVSGLNFTANIAAYNLSGSLIKYDTGVGVPTWNIDEYQGAIGWTFIGTLITNASGLFTSSSFADGDRIKLDPQESGTYIFSPPILDEVFEDANITGKQFIASDKPSGGAMNYLFGSVYYCENPSGLLIEKTNGLEGAEVKKLDQTNETAPIAPASIVDEQTTVVDELLDYYPNYNHFPVNPSQTVRLRCEYLDNVNNKHNFRILKDTRGTPQSDDGDILLQPDISDPTDPNPRYDFTTPPSVSDEDIPTDYAAILFTISGEIILTEGDNTGITVFANPLTTRGQFPYSVRAIPDPNNPLRATYSISGLPGSLADATNPSYNIIPQKPGYEFTQTSGDTSLNLHKTTYPIQFLTGPTPPANGITLDATVANQVTVVGMNTNWVINKLTGSLLNIYDANTTTLYTGLVVVSNTGNTIIYSGTSLPSITVTDGWMLVAPDNPSDVNFEGDPLYFTVRGELLDWPIGPTATIEALNLNTQTTTRVGTIRSDQDPRRFSAFYFPSLVGGDYRFTVQNHPEYNTCYGTDCNNFCCLTIDSNVSNLQIYKS